MKNDRWRCGRRRRVGRRRKAHIGCEELCHIHRVAVHGRATACAIVEGIGEVVAMALACEPSVHEAMREYVYVDPIGL
jgi:hypothetical protein